MAGSWSAINFRSNGAKGASDMAMFSAVADFTADAVAATIPDLPITDINPSRITDIGVVFDGTTPPDSLTVTVKDIDGLTAWSGTFAASGRLACDERPAILGGCTVACSGNTTNAAKAKVIAYFASNLR